MVYEAGVLMAETVMVLPPDVRGEQVIQRRDGPSPRNLQRGLEPFRVLVEHGIDDVDKGLIAGEEAVAAREQITLQPALAHVFAENFQDAAIGRNMVVGGQAP